jgi:hypothetical protein
MTDSRREARATESWTVSSVKYADVAAFQRDLPSILQKLGFSAERPRTWASASSSTCARVDTPLAL